MTKPWSYWWYLDHDLPVLSVEMSRTAWPREQQLSATIAALSIRSRAVNCKDTAPWLGIMFITVCSKLLQSTEKIEIGLRLCNERAKRYAAQPPPRGGICTNRSRQIKFLSGSWLFRSARHGCSTLLRIELNPFIWKVYQIQQLKCPHEKYN